MLGFLRSFDLAAFVQFAGPAKKRGKEHKKQGKAGNPKENKGIPRISPKRGYPPGGAPAGPSRGAPPAKGGSHYIRRKGGKT